MLGAFLQGLLCLLPYRNIALVAPVSLALAFSITRTLLMARDLIRSPYMDGVIDGRTAILFPDDSGSYEKAGDRQLCTIVLGARSNHPLGMFAPGFKEVGDYLKSMCAELDQNPSKHGFLGNSTWLSAGERGVSSEVMTICYFDSPASVHAYAHEPVAHRRYGVVAQD